MKTCRTLAMPLLLLTVSCTSIDDNAEHIGTLNLKLDFDLDMVMTGVANDAGIKSSGDGKTYELRHTVEAYRKSADGVVDEVPARRFVFKCEDAFANSADLPVSLEDGLYEFLVWTDFVEAGTETDYFYDTRDLRNIRLAGSHKGNNDFMDAFFGRAEVEVSEGHGNVTEDCGIVMERAVSKCDYFALDLSDIVSGISGADLDECTVTFFYTGRIPSGFDALSGETCMTRSGVEFSSTVALNKDIRMTKIGFDYMFTDAEESSVSLLIGIFDSKGRLLTTTTHMNVPVMRNTHASMNCDFITPTEI